MNTALGYLGNIPDGWKLVHLGRLTSEVKALNSDCSETNALQFKMGSIISKSNGDSKYHPETLEGYTIVAPGDVVVNGLNLNYDLKSLRVGQVLENGVITSAYIIVRPEKIDADYFKYLLKGFDSIKTFHGMGKGIRLTLGYEELRRMYIPVPSPSEQSRIAAFLDERCAKIDEAVARHKALIEKLDEYRKAVITKAVTKGVRGEREMKESGFERIGLIPSEWYYRPLKSIGRFYGGMSGKAGDDFKVEDGEAFTYFIPYTNIFNNFEVSPSILAKVKIKEGETQNCVHKGDLLFLMSSEDYAGLGQTSVMLYEIDNLWLNSFCKGLTNKSTDVDSKYLNYFLSSELIHDYIRVKGEGYTRINLKTSNLGMCPVFVPTPEEQSEIVTFLDKKCAAIDSAKERHQQLIVKLEEYKKSLIYNAVTGKIEC